MPFKLVFANAIAAYRKNFGKLFVPLLVLQLVILLPLMFFTMPGTVNSARTLLVAVSSFSMADKGTSTVVYALTFILLILLFFSPLIVINTIYVIDRDFHSKDVTFRESILFGKKKYGHMLKSYFAAIAAFLPIGLIIASLLASVFASGLPSSIAALATQEITVIVLCAVLALLFLLGVIFLPYTVVSEGTSAFGAIKTSFKYVYKGNFLSTLSRLALAAGVIGALMFFINWLSQLPFRELFHLYLSNPLEALKQPLMVFAIVLSVATIFITAFIMPFWYAFSYNTYQSAKLDYEKKYDALH